MVFFYSSMEHRATTEGDTMKAQFKLNDSTRNRLRSFKQDNHQTIKKHFKKSKDLVTWDDVINYLLDKRKR